MSAIPSRAAFGTAVGTRFRIGAVSGLGGPADVALRAVEERRTPAEWECFSMLFEGTIAGGFLQGSFPVSHPQLGEFELFLVPIDEKDGVRTYEAIVYRPLPNWKISQ